MYVAAFSVAFIYYQQGLFYCISNLFFLRNNNSDKFLQFKISQSYENELFVIKKQYFCCTGAGLKKDRLARFFTNIAKFQYLFFLIHCQYEQMSLQLIFFQVMVFSKNQSEKAIEDMHSNYSKFFFFHPDTFMCWNVACFTRIQQRSPRKCFVEINTCEERHM